MLPNVKCFIKAFTNHRQQLNPFMSCKVNTKKSCPSTTPRLEAGGPTRYWGTSRDRWTRHKQAARSARQNLGCKVRQLRRPTTRSRKRKADPQPSGTYQKNYNNKWNNHRKGKILTHNKNVPTGDVWQDTDSLPIIISNAKAWETPKHKTNNKK